MNYLPETNFLIETHNISRATWMNRLAGQTLSFSDLDLYALMEYMPKDATEGADFIVAQVPSCLSYNGDSKTWYVWNGRVHEPLTANTVPLQLIDILGYAIKDVDAFLAEYVKAGTKKIKAENLEDAETKKRIADLAGPVFNARKVYSKFATSLHSNKGVKDVLDKMSRAVSKSKTHFENDRDWLVVRNGVIDSRTTAPPDRSPSRPQRNTSGHPLLRRRLRSNSGCHHMEELPFLQHHR